MLENSTPESGASTVTSKVNISDVPAAILRPDHVMVPLLSVPPPVMLVMLL